MISQVSLAALLVLAALAVPPLAEEAGFTGADVTGKASAVEVCTGGYSSDRNGTTCKGILIRT